MNYISALVALLLLVTSSICAQDKDNKATEEDISSTFLDNIYYGGDLRMGFGDITYIEVSPLAGYKISSRFSAGIGGLYQYVNFRYSDVSSHIYGGRLFGMGVIKEPFFGQIEYEYLNYELPPPLSENNRLTSHSVFAGGGLVQRLSSKVSVVATALYNITYKDTPEAFYNNPFVFRLGFLVGY